MEVEASIIAEPLDINIKTMDSKIYYTIVPPDALVLDLKVMLKERTLVPEDRQRLIYRGRVLEDENTVASYNITPGNTLHMIARPENYRELQQEATAPSLPSSSRDASAGQQGNSANLAAPILEYLFGQSLRGNMGSVESPAAVTDGEAMEPLWQSLLSLHTLLSVTGGRESGVGAEIAMRSLGYSAADISMRALNAEVGAGAAAGVEEPAAASANGADAGGVGNTGAGDLLLFPASPGHGWNRSVRYFEGQWLDVKDTVAQWLEATVMEVDLAGRRIYVHYNGWPVRWDEWLPFESARVAPFRSMTRHTTTSGRNLLSPEPVTRLPNAVRVGGADPRFVLLELARMTRRIQPILDEAAEAVERSMVVAPVEPMSRSVQAPAAHPLETPPAAPSSAARYSPFSSPIGSAIPETPAGEYPTTDAMRLAELSSQLCPLLDRMGRLMTDFAPHLRLSADSTLFGPEAATEEAHPFQTSGSSPQEVALAALMRQRPASPEPERAFRQPIVSRSVGMGGLGPALSSLGANGHVDITLSILSPMDLVQRSVERNALTRTLSSLNTVLNLHSLISEHEQTGSASRDEAPGGAVHSSDVPGSTIVPLTAVNVAASASAENSTHAPIFFPVPATGAVDLPALPSRSSSDSLVSEGAAPQERRSRGTAAAGNANLRPARSGSMIRSIGRMFGFGR